MPFLPEVPFAFTGAIVEWEVPERVISINYEVVSGSPALGGDRVRVEGTTDVTPGQILHILVGGGAVDEVGGWPDGGDAGNDAPVGNAPRGGGGSSSIRTTVALADSIVVAGGAGGWGGFGSGGDGGDPDGGDGSGFSAEESGSGATQFAGGAGGVTPFPGGTYGEDGTDGVAGQGGDGGDGAASSLFSTGGGSGSVDAASVEVGGGYISGDYDSYSVDYPINGTVTLTFDDFDAVSGNLFVAVTTDPDPVGASASGISLATSLPHVVNITVDDQDTEHTLNIFVYHQSGVPASSSASYDITVESFTAVVPAGSGGGGGWFGGGGGASVVFHDDPNIDWGAGGGGSSFSTDPEVVYTTVTFGSGNGDITITPFQTPCVQKHFEYPYRWPDLYTPALAGDDEAIDRLAQRDIALEDFFSCTCAPKEFRLPVNWPEIHTTLATNPYALTDVIERLESADRELESHLTVHLACCDDTPPARCNFEYPARWPDFYLDLLGDDDDKRRAAVLLLEDRDRVIEDHLNQRWYSC